MKTIFKTTTLVMTTVLLLSSQNLVFNTPAIAQRKCGNTEPVEASKTTRTIKLKQFGIKVKIPANFRTILRKDGSVMILDPGSYEAMRCRAPHGIYSFSIKSLPNPQQLSLLELAKISYPNITGETPNIHNYSFNNTQALIIDAQGGYGAYGIFNVPGKGVIEMSAGCDCEVDKTCVIEYLQTTELLK
ncbi:hypothetical protein H6G54_29180 [Anabaena cylindrica FACHB-243]|uniref:Uncharacterized protein n=1 Tax=Anabaena cylindrica (strain ATCC 27899 / PCC 7122) TaxID=272123 RepID=K9ZPR8_ANACC|nr:MULTISPECIES: hypothetical protein [Anabaena]AFZ61203.1 hypothetical protein Anacy_5914 [Anabaena cylindrica PCC 7122]MBD2421679.1 hypothetical protein [Anabaena cylindrica FACHB-243]MBY5280422.1 hypothetical protein [Anabaena sp. CCAP 1446/1C]MBY5308153.1 hypothetical protein [Anabaena sp. CCAP 1446/1C]MCM2405418.1 hypothetical protein [Anabaena sp. CCAP 1446/1C]